MPRPPASTPISARAVFRERMEQADGIAAAADARDERRRQRPSCARIWPPRPFADDALETPHHLGIGMRAVGGAKQ